MNFEVDEKRVKDVFKYFRWYDDVFCPYCKSSDINKRGDLDKKKNFEHLSKKYECKECGKFFNDFTGTPFNNRKIKFEKILYILFNAYTEDKKLIEIEKETRLGHDTVSRTAKSFKDFCKREKINLSNNDFDEEKEESETKSTINLKEVKENYEKTKKSYIKRYSNEE